MERQRAIRMSGASSPATPLTSPFVLFPGLTVALKPRNPVIVRAIWHDYRSRLSEMLRPNSGKHINRSAGGETGARRHGPIQQRKQHKDASGAWKIVARTRSRTNRRMMSSSGNTRVCAWAGRGSNLLLKFLKLQF